MKAKHTNVKKQLLLALLGSVALGASARAAIIGLADSLNQTGAAEIITVRDIADISPESSIYVAGNMTFNTVDITQAVILLEVQIAGVNNAYRIGNGTNDDDFWVIKPTAFVLDPTIASGDSHSVVLKMDTVTGAYSVWMDPDLGLTEASTVADVTSSHANGIGTMETVRFRTNGGSDADFTDFAVYTGSDTPFSVVPEPDSVALLGLAGLALILRRRK